MTGVVIFHISDNGKLAVDDSIRLFKSSNAALLERFAKDGYRSIYIPAPKEAYRLDKIKLKPSKEGMVVFYVNHDPESDDLEAMIARIKDINSDIIRSFADINLDCMFVPTSGESSRVAITYLQ